MCKNENLEKLKTDIDEIRRKHNFQTGEMKSSGVGPNQVVLDLIIHDAKKYLWILHNLTYQFMPLLLTKDYFLERGLE
jgi:hypothetical protein